MHFVTRSQVRSRLEGKSIALVGSGPGVLDNPPGLIDAHEVVVRVNNYKLSPAAGFRTDVFYSYFGGAIRKTAAELRRDGVTLCLCKCPDGQPIESEWHRKNDKMAGVDFRWIYRKRAGFWFCDTFVPSIEDFMAKFRLLGGHVPTTGFAAILDLLDCNPKRLYLTGFDFFRSRVHNVDQPWSRKNADDPIGHVPERELSYLASILGRYPITWDRMLDRTLNGAVAA